MDVNFGIDPYWFRAYPLRQKAAQGALTEIEVCVLNHFSPKRARVALSLAAGPVTGPPQRG